MLKLRQSFSSRTAGMLRALAVFLSAVLLLLAVSCAGGTPVQESPEPEPASDAVSAEESKTQQDPYRNAEGKYSLDGVNMPAFDFQETEFRVLVYSNHVQTTYFSEEVEPDMYETTDAVLNEAVRTRNDLLEERYGVKIKAVAVDSVGSSLRESVTTATDVCDAAMPFFSDAAVLAQEGILYDLKQFEKYIHLEAPWWDQSANRTLSVDQKLYFTTGDISIMQKITSGAVLFNKTLYAETLEETYGSLYDKVKNHEWTFDLMYEMTHGLNRNLDEDPAMEAGSDFFGMSSGNGDAIAFYLGFGGHIIDKGPDDLPYLALGETEESISLSRRILERLTEPDYMLISEDYKGKVPNCWEYCLATFGENRSVMRTTAFSAIKKLRAFEGTNPFGIVPFPLSSPLQEDYCTPCGGTYAYGVAIPLNAKNPDFSAFMLEAMACEGKNLITPAYYETTLKSRDLAYDDESGEMLDSYIFKNMMYELANVYNFGGISSMFGTLMSQKSSDVVSNLDAIRTKVDSAIKECVEIYRADVA